MPLAETRLREPVPGEVYDAALCLLAAPHDRSAGAERCRRLVLAYAPGMDPVASARRVILKAATDRVARECAG